MKAWNAAYAIVARAPVLLGAFITTGLFLWVHGGDGRAVVVSGVAWAVHLFSTPTIKVEKAKRDAHAAGYTKAIGDVQSLAPSVRVVPPPIVATGPPL